MNIKKYLKYPSDDESNTYWKYCMANMVPCMQIHEADSSMDYLDVDCLPVFNLTLPLSMGSEELVEQFLKYSSVEQKQPNLVMALIPLYKLYFNLFPMPEESYKWCGGTRNAGLNVLKDHSEMFATHLHDYFIGIRDDFFKKEGFDLDKFIVPTE